MKTKMKMSGMIFFALLSITSLTTAQETQIPIDSQGKIEFIDAKLEQKLGLFAEYENFREARLFQISEADYVLEIVYQPQDKVLKKRISLSAAEMKNLQSRVSEQINQKTPEVTLDQEGRAKLLVGTTSLALGFYGWALPVAIKIDDGKVALALYMLTSGAGFFIPFSMTRDLQVTDAAATLSLYGGSRGILHGFALAGIISEEPSMEGLFAAAIVAGIGEAIYGFRYADQRKLSAGTAEMIGLGGDFGVGLAVGVSHLADFFEHEDGRAIFGSILVGSGIGLTTGKWLAQQQSYTRGDAYVLGTTGLLGAYVPLAIVDMFNPDQEKAYSAAAMAGAICGIGLGQHLIRGKDFTTAQSNYIQLSTVAGGLLGAGLAYLLSSDDDDDVNSTLYLTSSSAGAIAGYWLMYRSLAKSATITENSSSWKINLHPEALVVMVNGKNSNSHFVAPLITAWYQF